MSFDDALCARVVTPDYDPFYAPEGEQPAERRVRENEAVAICQMCPALAACGRLAKADEGLREWAVIAGLKPPRRQHRAIDDNTRQAIAADLRNVRAAALERTTV